MYKVLFKIYLKLYIMYIIGTIQQIYNICVPIHKNKELIHVLIPLKKNQFQESFLY